MATNLKPFKYGVSHKIIFWGCVFDSLLELKYALSIQHEYEFIRSHIPIYYDPRTKRPTNYIRDNIRRYTPDFLIRHKTTGEAFLIEIKPRAFAGDQQLLLRQEVAENYILWKNYDWKYKVVFDDEIILTQSEIEQFNECRKLICKSARKLEFEKYNRQFDRSMPSFYTKVPDNKCIHFVMFGNKGLAEKPKFTRS